MTTYSISLDDVDLALLPLRSCNTFLKKELYHFEVKKTVTVEVPEPSNLYTCHICAIDMPAAFAREHVTSVKHRANTRIASVAAKRMFALITALPPPPEESNVRFCANCATVADEHHDKTKEHSDAVKFDNLLWELMMAYAENDKSNYQQVSEDRTQNDYMNRSIDVDFKHVDTNNIISQTRNMDQTTVIVKDNKQMQEEKRITEKTEINNNLERSEFSDDASDHSNSTENDNATIEAGDNIVDTLQYPYEITSKGAWCVICECKVTGGLRNRDEHVRGARHRNMVINMNQQMDVIDSLEEYIDHEELSDDTNDNISECNSTTEADDTVVQITSKDVANAIEYPYELTAIGQVWCVVCNCQVPSGVYNREEHVKGMRHRNMVLTTKQITKPIVPIEEKRQGEYSEDGENGDINENVSINSNENLKDTESNDSDYNKDEQFEDSKINNYEEYNHNEENRNIIQNIEETLDSQIKYPFEATDKDDVVWCVVCECEVPSGVHNREQHLKGRKHRIMALKENQSTESTDEDQDEELTAVTEVSIAQTSEVQIGYPYEMVAGRVRCMVCKCGVPGGERNRNDHVQGWRHRNMIINQNQASKTPEENNTDIEINDMEDNNEDEEFLKRNDNQTNGNDIDDSQIEYPFEATKTGLRCVVCNCLVVPNNAGRKAEHIKGQNHTKLVKLRAEMETFQLEFLEQMSRLQLNVEALSSRLARLDDN